MELEFASLLTWKFHVESLTWNFHVKPEQKNTKTKSAAGLAWNFIVKPMPEKHG